MNHGNGLEIMQGLQILALTIWLFFLQAKVNKLEKRK
jgi:hypothetical protein